MKELNVKLKRVYGLLENAKIAKENIQKFTIASRKTQKSVKKCVEISLVEPLHCQTDSLITSALNENVILRPKFFKIKKDHQNIKIVII